MPVLLAFILLPTLTPLLGLVYLDDNPALPGLVNREEDEVLGLVYREEVDPPPLIGLDDGDSLVIVIGLVYLDVVELDVVDELGEVYLETKVVLELFAGDVYREEEEPVVEPEAAGLVYRDVLLVIPLIGDVYLEDEFPVVE